MRGGRNVGVRNSAMQKRTRTLLVVMMSSTGLPCFPEIKISEIHIAMGEDVDSEDTFSGLDAKVGDESTSREARSWIVLRWMR